MSKEIIRVPDIGSSDPVDVIELLVQVGDTLTQDASLLVLESAKASVELPSPVAGKVLALKVKVGDRVQVGDALLEVEVDSDKAPQPSVGASHAGEPVSEAPQTLADVDGVKDSQPLEGAGSIGEPPAASHDQDATLVHAGPAVRKLARQLGVSLAEVQASGAHQRILKEDVHAYVARRLQQPSGSVLASLPEIDFSQFGEIERVATSSLRRTAARRLQQGWQQIPQVTQHELVDITELEAFRQAENQRQPQKLSLLAFVARALVAALHEFPHFNASLSGDGSELILKHYVHLGFAVDTERGLLVPVLKNADHLGVRDIAQGVAVLADKARSRKLLPTDMQGASITISSLGGIGGTAFTPLVNYPEVAILGLSRADWQPLWQQDSGSFEARLMLPLSLSYDHRVIDGAEAARFVVFLREQLTDLRRLLL